MEKEYTKFLYKIFKLFFNGKMRPIFSSNLFSLYLYKINPKNILVMPYPNEHAARIRQPNRFKNDTFRRKNITPGIDIIMAQLKNGSNKMVIQAYRFKKSKFTAKQAKKWLREHDINPISFEVASNN